MHKAIAYAHIKENHQFIDLIQIFLDYWQMLFRFTFSLGLGLTPGSNLRSGSSLGSVKFIFRCLQFFSVSNNTKEKWQPGSA